jgi:hypothetical protein
LYVIGAVPEVLAVHDKVTRLTPPWAVSPVGIAAAVGGWLEDEPEAPVADPVE